jgi:tight adherence protein B
MPASTWVAAGLVFTAAVFGTLFLVLVFEGVRSWSKKRRVARRLRPVVLELDHDFDGSSSPIIRERSEEDLGLGAALASRLPLVRDLSALLQQAGLDWSVTSFLAISLGLAVAIGAAAAVVSPSTVAFVFGALIGAPLPLIYVRRRKAQRLAGFEEHFPESVDLLTRAIRAGHPLSAGMKMVAEEAPEVVAREFQQAFEEQRYGLPFQDALLGIPDRIDLMDVRIFATAVLVQREVGGNLAEILDKLAQTVRARFAIRRQLRTYTAQGRLSGYILGALPIVVGLVIFLVNREYMMTLVTEGVGRFMILVALILQIFGYLWIRKIVNIEI